MTTNIEFEICPIDEACDAISETINRHFLKDVLESFRDPEMESKIDQYLEPIRDDIYCVIEFPYVDKVFRDSYYSYYSSKHITYQRDCIRVSLFEGEISQDDFFKPENHEELRKKYKGYFVIRPTVTALFGRATINPEAFSYNNFKICRSKDSSMVFGVKFNTEGFPHSSQDGETISCAETTIWGLMEYFGNKYPEYKPTLPSKIIQTLTKYSHERQLPSTGLTMDQVSYSLKEFGFGTRYYATNPYGETLENIIDYYVESGIPVVAGLESNDAGHAILVIGKKYEDAIEWENIRREEIQFPGKEKTKFIDATNLPSKYVVQDDNLQPYRLISLDKPGEHYSDTDAQGYKIDSVVVPLYPKIYLEAVVAKQLLIQIIKDETVGFSFPEDFVFRFFLASSRSFKSHISTLYEMDYALKYTIISAKMPKFIWCAEVYKKEGYQSQIASGLIIMDATEANSECIDALIFAGYPDRCITMVENNFAELGNNFQNYRSYSNLA
ncbi:MAG: hypothetical protein H6581_09495 [Bacteroidia bacterium]|nr:hypothetical protein [Bacteroidia bacterium]